jgi:hypothetical protein
VIPRAFRSCCGLAIVIAVLLIAIPALGEDQAAPPPPPAPAAGAGDQDQKDVVVYITRTGKKYHTAECRYAKVKSTLKQAKALGLEPCKLCHPPE